MKYPPQKPAIWYSLSLCVCMSDFSHEYNVTIFVYKSILWKETASY